MSKNRTTMAYRDMFIQNLKTIITLKSSGISDADIAERVGIPLREFLIIKDSDDYIKEKYSVAGDTFNNELEANFKAVMLAKLNKGDTTDAKWLMERTNSKFTEKKTIDMTMSIDDIIKMKAENKNDES